MYRKAISRLSALKQAGLIRKRDNEYYMTSFGKLVFGVQLKVAKASDMQWKPKAIEPARDVRRLS